MPDWDENSPELRENLKQVLRDIRDSAQQRKTLGVEAIREWHRGIMKGLNVPNKKWIGKFRGEVGLKKEVRIHPFANGNGRIARLLANAIALRYGLPPFVQLRPRPNQGYPDAAEASMLGDYKPLAIVFDKMLQAYLSKPN